MKKKREARRRRSTIGEVMQITPHKSKQTLAEASAEQLALEAAARHDEYLNTMRKSRAKGKKKSKGASSTGLESNRMGAAGKEQSPWARRRPRHSYWGATPPDPTVLKMFEETSEEEEDEGEVTPMDEGTDTEESGGEPNTEDRAFLKDKEDETSDGDYVPTDAEREEVDADSSWG